MAFILALLLFCTLAKEIGIKGTTYDHKVTPSANLVPGSILSRGFKVVVDLELFGTTRYAYLIAFHPEAVYSKWLKHSSMPIRIAIK